MKQSILVVVCLVASAALSSAAQIKKQCSVEGPGYILDNEVEPLLQQCIGELRLLTDALMDKYQEGMAHLIPLVVRSPLGDFKEEEYFGEIKSSIDNYYQMVHNEIVLSWRNLTKENEIAETRLANTGDKYFCAFAIGGSKKDYHPFQYIFADLGEKVDKIHDTFDKSADIMKSLLKELSLTTQTIVMNSITVIMETFELDHLPAEDKERLFKANLHKVAPNFFGMVLRKVMMRGSDPKGFRKIEDDVLRRIADTFDKMQKPLQELSNQSTSCSHVHDIFTGFWRSQVEASRARYGERPYLTLDIITAYENEFYVSEVGLSLMASYQDE